MAREWSMDGFTHDITILQGNSLEPKDGKTSDPYVKLGFVYSAADLKLASKYSIHGTTKTIKKTLNPIWNEKFEMTSPADIKYLDVLFEIWDSNSVMKDVQMGICRVSVLDLQAKSEEGKQTIVLPVLPYKPGKKAMGNLTIEVTTKFDHQDGLSAYAKSKGITGKPEKKDASSSSSATSYSSSNPPPVTATAKSYSSSNPPPASNPAEVKMDEFTVNKGKRRQATASEPFLTMWADEPTKLEQETQDNVKLVLAALEKSNTELAAMESEIAELDIAVQGEGRLVSSFWRAVLPSLPTSAVLALWHTGDSHLRLCIGRYVKVLRLTPGARHPIKVWPHTLISSLRALEEISITYRDMTSEAAVVLTPAHIEGLSPRITKIDLDMDLRIKNTANLPTGLTFWRSDTSFKPEIVQHFPRSLTTLKIIGNAATDGFFEALPRGLKTLELKNPSVFLRRVHEDVSYAHMPRGLTHFFSNYPVSHTAMLLLPPNLVFLHIVGKYGETSECDDSLVSTFPSTLTHLTLRNSFVITNDIIPMLPRSLTVLNIPSCEKITGRNFNMLPPGLTTLDVSGLDDLHSEAATMLPAGLKTLNYNFDKHGAGTGINLSCKALTTFTASSALKLGALFVDRLPKTVTHLDLSFSNELQATIVGSLPPQLVYLSLWSCRGTFTAAHTSKLPKTLKTLRASMATFVLDAIKALPEGLTSLHVGMESDKCVPYNFFEFLPPGLTYLDSGKISLGLSFLEAIPKTLQHFHVNSYVGGCSAAQIINALPNLINLHLDDTLGKPTSLTFWDPSKKLE